MFREVLLNCLVSVLIWLWILSLMSLLYVELLSMFFDYVVIEGEMILFGFFFMIGECVLRVFFM